MLLKSNMNTCNGLELCVLSGGPDFGAKVVPGMNVAGTEVLSSDCANSQ